LTNHHHATLAILPKKAINVIKQNGYQFFIGCKSHRFKQQISKFYLQFLSTGASFHIYYRSLTDTNVIASICACVEFVDKVLIFAFLKWWLFTARHNARIATVA